MVGSRNVSAHDSSFAESPPFALPSAIMSFPDYIFRWPGSKKIEQQILWKANHFLPSPGKDQARSAESVAPNYFGALQGLERRALPGSLGKSSFSVPSIASVPSVVKFSFKLRPGGQLGVLNVQRPRRIDQVPVRSGRGPARFRANGRWHVPALARSPGPAPPVSGNS